MISESLKPMDANGRITVRNWDFSSQHESIARPSDSPGTRGNASEYQTKFLKMSAYQDRSSPITESNPDMYPINFAWVPQSEFSPSTKSSAMKTSVNLETTNMLTTLPMSDNPSTTSQLQNKVAAKARKNQPSAKKNKPTTPKALKTKSLKQPSTPKKEKNSSKYIGRREKRNLEEVAEGFTHDFSGVPSPVCSCTGIPRQCYRWGAGGWQSSCCTTAISEYPLPMSTARPGSRLAGRKMSNGAYRKLLRRLAVEGQDLTNAVDLKDHWARHGTNKFVTIK